jgi:hypothetical protein
LAHFQTDPREVVTISSHFLKGGDSWKLSPPF